MKVKETMKALVALVVMFFIVPVHFVAAGVTRWCMEMMLQMAVWSRRKEGDHGV